MPGKGEFGLKNGIDFNDSINELPAKVFIELRNKLDVYPDGKDWRALARAVEKEYKISQSMIEKWSPALSDRSPAGKLLTELSSLGMTIKELANYLHRIEIDTYSFGLTPYAEIQIIKKPPTDVEVYEGDPLVIEVEATGSPYPKYQWFFCQNGQDDFTKCVGSTEKVLRVIEATTANAGTYSCQISNCKDPKKTKLTNHTVVTVIRNPVPPNSGLNPPGKDEVMYLYNQYGLSSPSSIDDMPDLNNRLDKRSSTVGYNLIMGHPKDVLVGMNEAFVLTVLTAGNSPIFYQWYRNGLKIEGEVGPKLSVRHASILDFAKYYCVVRNGAKTEQSRTAFVKEKFPRPDSNVEILLVSQPKSVSVKFGGGALFSCEARCCEPLVYQWFKDGKPLEGKVSSEIKFMNIQDRRVEGLYQCMISVDARGDNGAKRMTVCALLTVEVPLVKDNIEYNPSDKVALLIGNADYKSEAPLSASTIDVQVLSESFRALDFRVVSLLNLTKPEIENAVLHLLELLGENVYTVFYFCGHGFEEYGFSYLVPTDAPAAYTAQECVCAQEVLANLQKKDPAVIFMILDICRQPGKVRSTAPPKTLPTKSKGNTVFCYATSEGLAAYENKNGGLLVNHLSPLLRKNLGIDALVSEVKAEFARVRKHYSIQIPEQRSNLLENQRSLTDKISKKGQTEAFQRRDIIWNSAHEKPPKQKISFEEVGAVIELDFQAEFSNVLHVFTTVTDHGRTQGCIGKITNFSPPISALGKIEEYKQYSRVVTKISLQDIQKLKDNLIVDVTITFFVNNTQYFLLRRVNLGQPLVAKLRLWEQCHNFTPNSREAIQQDEESDSTNSYPSGQ